MASSNPVVKFPVKPRKKDRPVLASIVDLRGTMANYIQGTASASSNSRARTVGVTLPPLSFYGGKPCQYLNGCLYVGDEVIRRRKF